MPNLGQNRRFFWPCDLEIWQMTLKNNRTPLLSIIKLCASFHHHMWIQTGVTVRKRLSRVWPLWPWPLTLTFCMDITLVIGNNSWKFHDDMMMGTLSKRCHRQTDRQTEIAILKAAWTQLKIMIWHVFQAVILSTWKYSDIADGCPFSEFEWQFFKFFDKHWHQIPAFLSRGNRDYPKSHCLTWPAFCDYVCTAFILRSGYGTISRDRYHVVPGNSQAKSKRKLVIAHSIPEHRAHITHDYP